MLCRCRSERGNGQLRLVAHHVPGRMRIRSAALKAMFGASEDARRPREPVYIAEGEICAGIDGRPKKLSRYQWFESISLQRGVRELSVPGSRRERAAILGGGAPPPATRGPACEGPGEAQPRSDRGSVTLYAVSAPLRQPLHDRRNHGERAMRLACWRPRSRHDVHSIGRDRRDHRATDAVQAQRRDGRSGPLSGAGPAASRLQRLGARLRSCRLAEDAREAGPAARSRSSVGTERGGCGALLCISNPYRLRPW